MYKASRVASDGHVGPSPLPREALLKVRWPLSFVANAPRKSPEALTGPKVHLAVSPHLKKISRPSVVTEANSLLSSPSNKKRRLLPPETSVITQPLVQLLNVYSAVTFCGLPAAPMLLEEINPSHFEFTRLVKNSRALSLRSIELGVCSSRQIDPASSVVQRVVLCEVRTVTGSLSQELVDGSCRESPPYSTCQ